MAVTEEEERVPPPVVNGLAVDNINSSKNGTALDTKVEKLDGAIVTTLVPVDPRPPPGGDVTPGAPASAPAGVPVAPTSEGSQLVRVKKIRRLREKLTFIISLVSLVFLAVCLATVPWLLPYYYAVSTPLLIALRIAQYIKLRYQYFLIDFCYFGNTLVYIYLWAAPWQPELFALIFALANGPLACATIIFRNSLVFHLTDKMTSVYIHVLPMYITYAIRWYPADLSAKWYTPFVSNFNDDISYMFIWLVGAAFASFVLHTVIYLFVVYVVCRPDESYTNSYRYLTSRGGWVGKLLNFCGHKGRVCMFSTFYCLYSLAALLLAMLCYKYFIAHAVCVIVITLVTAWNGAAYYMDVFVVKGFNDQP